MSVDARSSLLDFAEYLAQKSSLAEISVETQEKSQPVVIARPENENVINAIKRLRASYYMLNTDGLLNEASTLMTQYMVHGRDQQAVIDDLETLFDNHFQKYLQS